jgi:hypothetical protein
MYPILENKTICLSSYFESDKDGFIEEERLSQYINRLSTIPRTINRT